ncbi:ubiquinone anaerobic biosynthesis accessory factor UbiT [Roseateles microcysteis]|uniref:ubiquinone anaerobic biosynthesis accessory factor UbiT n=1 Tax=Roseateles microcysteis TaxID=3119057 RepID=UPI002FE5A58A
MSETSAVRRLLATARSLVRRLPAEPPSFLAARALDQLLWPRLDAAQRQALQGRVVELELIEPGLRLRLRLGPQGFRVARARDGTTALTLRARSEAIWRLLRGQEDADRLFFERALVMEGDTEYGLILKNTLDAIGPLIKDWPASGLHQ